MCLFGRANGGGSRFRPRTRIAFEPSHSDKRHVCQPELATSPIRIYILDIPGGAIQITHGVIDGIATMRCALPAHGEARNVDTNFTRTSVTAADGPSHSGCRRGTTR
jgi:hypothetical protein